MGLSEELAADLAAVSSFDELVKLLRQLLDGSGKPYRKLQPAGVSPTTVSTVLNGKRDPSRTFIEQFLIALDVEPHHRTLWISAWSRCAAARRTQKSNDVHDQMVRARTDLETLRQTHEAAIQDHLATLTGIVVTLHQLAKSFAMAGNLLAARQVHQIVYDISRRNFGLGSNHTLTALQSLAHVLTQMHEHEAAVDRLQEAIGNHDALPPDDRRTLNLRGFLARILYTQGNLKAARGHQEQVYERLYRTAGATDADTVRARDELAATIQAQTDAP